MTPTPIISNKEKGEPIRTEIIKMDEGEVLDLIEKTVLVKLTIDDKYPYLGRDIDQYKLYIIEVASKLMSVNPKLTNLLNDVIEAVVNCDTIQCIKKICHSLRKSSGEIIDLCP